MCTSHFCRDTGCTDAIALYNRVTEEEDGLPINVDRNSEEEGDDAGKSSKKRKAVSGIDLIVVVILAGQVAQLVKHSPLMREVRGSSPHLAKDFFHIKILG